MKHVVFLLLLTTCAAPALKVTFISTVDGLRYEAVTSTEAIKKAGALFAFRDDKEGERRSYWSEPKGVRMADALAKAEKEAERILGEDYTGKDGKWVLKSATREEQDEDAAGGYYYRFSYSTRRGAYSSEDWVGPYGNLQIIVLLDGTVIETEQVEAQGL